MLNEETLQMVESFKRQHPGTDESLALDCRIAELCLSQMAGGSDEKFKAQVEMMQKTYTNRLNDIRLVYLSQTLEDDILPGMRWEAERKKLEEEWKAKGSEGNRKMPDSRVDPARIKRQFDFLAEGVGNVVVPTNSPITLDFLVSGAIGRLCGYYGGNDDSIENLRATRNRLIEDLKKDPRTAKYATNVEQIKEGDERSEEMELHPNPPDAVEKPAISFAAAKPVAGAIVSLTLRERAGLARAGWPTVCGVPMPQGRVKDAAKLCLYAVQTNAAPVSGVPVPCQFTIQSRWPDGSPKWLLLEWQADVSASNTASYILAENATPPVPLVKTAVTFQQFGSAAGCVMDSGVLKVGIATNAPGLIHSVSLAGKQIVAPEDPVQATLVTEDDKAYRCGVPKKVTVETTGPGRATVLTEGEFVSAENGTNIFSGKVGYEMRTTVYAGKPYAKVDFTLINHGNYGYRNENRKRQWLYSKSLSVEMPVVATNMFGNTGTNWCAKLPAGWIVSYNADLTVQQWIKYPRRDRRNLEDCNSEDDAKMDDLVEVCMDQRSTPYYLVHRGYTVAPGGITNGAISEGWCESMIGQNRLAGAAVRRFWQNAPKGLSVQAGKVTIDLWPAGGFWPRTQKACDAKTYQFEGGREKTTEMLLVFGKDGPGTSSLSKGFESPLIAEASADWYHESGAIWPFAPGNLKTKDKELQEALDRYERMQLAKVHDEDGDPAGEPSPGWGDDWGRVSIPSLTARCPETMCGWMNFGDLVWSHGYCSLHYDWPYLMLAHHLRLGDPVMLDLADDMCRHRYDIDQYHVSAAPEYLGLFARYEKGEHGNLDRQPQKSRNWELNTAPSHTWNRGLLLWWALTGDRRALSAARENGEAYYRFFYGQNKLGQKDKLVYGEFRTPAWAIENWLALYEYTGEQKYLDWANEIFTKTLLAMEKDNGTKGHILKEGKQGAQFTGYTIEPVCRLHHLTGRQDVADYLKRVLDWQREKGTTGGVTKDGKYHPVKFLEDMSGDYEDGDAIGAGVYYDYLFADGYAYLYKIFGRKQDLEYARRLFRDGVFYFTFSAGVEPAARSPLGYHHLGDPFGSGEKLSAYNGRYPLIYLAVEKEFASADGKDR
ncbi:MAG: hypothetical protein C0404_02250 [Verrucomicrobia bacterium]|nr:hypothetical protein [Verrucomicrobiota bacterium]